jgi:hypothetical protein
MGVEGWIEVRDGNDSVRALFDEHYSRYHYADGRKPKLFVGPGEKLVLMTADARAVFVWRKFISRDEQHGVNCAVFRNTGGGASLASDLILQAEVFAAARWPNERLYTYVDPAKVRPTIVRGYPVWGFCFYKAGWKFSGVSKGGKIILDKREEVA